MLHLITIPADLQRFKENKLELKTTLPSTKKVLPPFGHLYEFFSQKFVHIGALHGQLQPLVSYENHSDELNANIQFLRISTWLIYVVTELLFIDLIDKSKYWKRIVSREATFQPSEETLQWQEQFLTVGRHDVEEIGV